MLHFSVVVQEAILLVGAATSPLELRLAVTSALDTALPDLVYNTNLHTLMYIHIQYIQLLSALYC